MQVLVVKNSLWKYIEKYHEPQTILPIFLFFDDYEIEIPFGSHSDIYKLTSIIPCIPTSSSAVFCKYYFLALLSHRADRQNFENKVIFKPL